MVKLLRLLGCAKTECFFFGDFSLNESHMSRPDSMIAHDSRPLHRGIL